MEPKTTQCFLLFTYLIIPVLVVAAFIIPIFTSAPEKSPGLSKDEELVAEFALNQTRQFIGGTLRPLTVTGIKVIDIYKKPGKTKIYLPNPNEPEGISEYTFPNDYIVRIKVYTYFGFSNTLKLKLGKNGVEEIGE
ncbi:hypothetical protein HX99_04690 [Peptococcaceae bacterium SCADC1_2_3]|jgi:hypothetical protein|nr:hypothetical protein DK28_0212920 [Peptococcaceae bacterium SCADC1_2_3]KFI36998.1 hypothetical protein HX99_04690 [Peptococcaceae bacterium SCADC1_2_3]KFI37296.1 hypothetical protein HY02_08455 [Peptococcaceae bacterium SCADC1_2_3]HBQ28588.1 hypothetical protein [Desulfotomaculum sp.]